MSAARGPGAAAFLLAAAVLGAGRPSAAAGAEAPLAPASPETARVAFVPLADTGYGFQAELRIVNASRDRRIVRWELAIAWPGRRVAGVWGADRRPDGDRDTLLLASPAGAPPIPPGGKAVASLAGTPGNLGAGPAVLALRVSTEAAPPPAPLPSDGWTAREGCARRDVPVAYGTDTSWPTGYTGRITVRNDGPTPLDDWLLTFVLPYRIAETWDGDVMTHSGTAYAVAPRPFFRELAPGGSARFVFNARYDAAIPDPAMPADIQVFACR